MWTSYFNRRSSDAAFENDNPDGKVFNFDTTKFDKFVYSVDLVYEDKSDSYLGQVLYMFNNR